MAAAVLSITSTWPVRASEALIHLGFVGATAVPLVAVRRERLFRVLAGAAALFLGFVSVVGAIAGLGIYGPSALLLLVAALVRPGWRPLPKKVVRVVAVTGGSLLLLYTAVAVYDTYLRPPNAYRVYLRSTTSPQATESLIHRLLDIPGVESVGGSFSLDADPLTVNFEDGMALQEQASLGERLRDVPNVARVELCRCP